MSETAAAPADFSQVVEELQAAVRRRFEAGEYPPELERELRERFEELARERELPDRFVPLMRRLDEASAFSPYRIQLVSSLPGGRRLHALVAALVRRQINGVLAQDRTFAAAVREVLTKVIQELPNRADPGALWDVPDGYLEALYGPRSGVVAALAAAAAELARAAPLLVIETGRSELVAAVRKTGAEPELGDVDAQAELTARGDATLSGLGVRRVLERFPPSALQQFASLASRKLKPGGRLLVVLRGRTAPTDPALPHSIDPGYLMYLLREEGFSSVEEGSSEDAQLITGIR